MSYMDIPNLYKAQEILLFKEIWSMEKLHGTSAHIGWKPEGGMQYFQGGTNKDSFLKLFDQEKLKVTFEEYIAARSVEKFPIIVYGEAYGGKLQGMSATYGKDLRFAAFEVKIGDHWLVVPAAEEISRRLGFDFVPYKHIPGTIEAVELALYEDSEQAIKNGMGPGHPREGIVLRPPIEVTKNNGSRIMAKHKNPKFSETKTPHEVDPARMKILVDAEAIAEEWVTPMRLVHVLDAFPEPWDMQITRDVIRGMIADVFKESKGEIIDSKEAHTAIGTRTAKLFKEKLNQVLKETNQGQ